MASKKKKQTSAKSRPKARPAQSKARGVKPKGAAKVARKSTAKSTAKNAAKGAAKSAAKAQPVAQAAAPFAPAPGAGERPNSHAGGDGLRTAKGILVKDKPWNKKELAHFEKRLMEERRRVTKQLGQWDDSMRSTIQNADGDLSAYSFHMADQGTDAMEREKAFLFASKEGRYLWHIDQALRRLYKTPETFGICEMTGERIEFERLDALPHARLSYKAKRQEEGDDEAE